MKRRDERLIDRRRHFKESIWYSLCPNDYPKDLTTHDFLKIVLTQAKKTYFRYVSFYCFVNWCETEYLETRLGRSEMDMFRLFDKVCSIKATFGPEIKSGHLEMHYNAFLSTIEEFSLGIVDDRIKAGVFLIESLKKELVA